MKLANELKEIRDRIISYPDTIGFTQAEEVKELEEKEASLNQELSITNGKIEKMLPRDARFSIEHQGYIIDKTSSGGLLIGELT